MGRNQFLVAALTLLSFRSALVGVEAACSTDSAPDSIAQAWLNEHNSRRSATYSANGLSDKDLSWSEDLAQASQDYAEVLAADSCNLAHDSNRGYVGENIAYFTGGSLADAPSVSLGLWYDDEENLPYGQNGHYTQVAWRVSDLLGCGQAQGTRNGVTCTATVCRYHQPGNCNIDASNFFTQMLAETQLCIGECPAYTGGGNGDPHLTKWNGEKYEFHGQCDLVLVQAPNFQDGLGLDIHIRTTILDYFSYIEATAVKAGDAIVNVDKDGFYVDEERITSFPAERGHFRVVRRYNPDKEVTSYFVTIQNTYKLSVRIGPLGYLHVNLIAKGQAFSNAPHFHASRGLLGEYPSGRTLGRDGATEFEDTEAFGREWQVQPEDGMLFLHVREPQAPRKCTMPPKRSETSRNLRANRELQEQAKEACRDAGADLMNECIEDVVSTGDVRAAAGY